MICHSRSAFAHFILYVQLFFKECHPDFIPVMGHAVALVGKDIISLFGGHLVVNGEVGMGRTNVVLKTYGHQDGA